MFRTMFVRRLPRLRIGVQLEPHRVEDGEGAGQAQSEDPAEVPHGEFLEAVQKNVASEDRLCAAGAQEPECT